MNRRVIELVQAPSDLRLGEVVFLFRQEGGYSVSREPGREAHGGKVALSGSVMSEGRMAVAAGMVRVTGSDGRAHLEVELVDPGLMRRALGALDARRAA